MVHGLMGRGSTWSRQLPWLTQLGAVYTYDAPWHRGRDVDDPFPVSTERFVADLADAVAALGTAVRLVGHSMGGLHAWCVAAERPELVSALVIEDMAPDFRGRTTGPWEPWLHNLPVEFDSAEQVYAEFGELAGRYFLEAFDRTETGGGYTGTLLDGSRSPPNGALVTTGRNGRRCVRLRYSSRPATRLRLPARCS